MSVPLSEHPLTSGANGTGIPVLVHKCLQFVEAQGEKEEASSSPIPTALAPSPGLGPSPFSCSISVMTVLIYIIPPLGLELEGIYRISGQKPKIIDLLQQFTHDPRTVVLDDSEYCVHDVTGTLKKFLKSLPDPLLTHQLYQAFLDAAGMKP